MIFYKTNFKIILNPLWIIFILFQFSNIKAQNTFNVPMGVHFETSTLEGQFYSTKEFLASRIEVPISSKRTGIYNLHIGIERNTLYMDFYSAGSDKIRIVQFEKQSFLKAKKHSKHYLKFLKKNRYTIGKKINYQIQKTLETHFVKYLDSCEAISAPEGLWVNNDGEKSIVFKIDGSNVMTKYNWYVLEPRIYSKGTLQVSDDGIMIHRYPRGNSSKTIIFKEDGGLSQNGYFEETRESYGFGSTKIEYARIYPTSTYSGGKESDKNLKDVKSTGTGFFVNSKGDFATCYHVVKNADYIKIKAFGKYYVAEVDQVDQANDIAILKLAKLDTSINIPYGFTDDINLGDEIFTLGYPKINKYGQNIKYTEGNVNSTTGFKDNSNSIQISSQIQPGNSGGPVFNSEGNLIGMITSSINQIKTLLSSGTIAQNVNYAVRFRYVNHLVERDQTNNVEKSSLENKEKKELINEFKDFVCLILVY